LQCIYIKIEGLYPLKQQEFIVNVKQFRILFVSFILFLTNGCNSLQIVDLKQEPITKNYTNNSTDLIVGIDPMDVVNEGYNDIFQWGQGLPEALHDEGVFKVISHSHIDKTKIDILITGKVGGDFHHSKAKNFFTWWPGPLIFAQSWRGTHYIFNSYADVTVSDPHTGEILGRYHADTSHELIHKSYNPTHILATAIIVPGLIKAGKSDSPRKRYREQLYEVAYPALWKNIAARIAKDQSKQYNQKITSLELQCGIRLNEDPKIGILWSEFVPCQTHQYRLLGEEYVKSDTVSVYVRNDKLFRIHVGSNGRIIRWYTLTKR